MFTTYQESVLDAADQDGCLNGWQVRRLLFEHGFTLTDLLNDYDDDEDVQAKLMLGDAETLLGCLGY